MKKKTKNKIYQIVDSILYCVWFIAMLKVVMFVLVSCLMVWIMVILYLTEHAPDSTALILIPKMLDWFNLWLIIFIVGIILWQVKRIVIALTTKREKTQ